MLLKKSLILFLLLVWGACQEEDNISPVIPDPIYLQDTTGDGPCLYVPCDHGRLDYYRFFNDLSARQGMWVNVRLTASTIDTIVFHNDSIYSHYSQNFGAYRHKYRMGGAYFEFYGDRHTNEPLSEPLRYYARYQDTTGILMVESAVPYNYYIRIQ